MMLDWDNLLPSPPSEEGPHFSLQGEESVPPCPTEIGLCPTQPGQRKPFIDGPFRGFVPVVPLVPVKKQGEELLDSAGAAGSLLPFRADNEGRAPLYPLNPSAVILLLAWYEQTQTSLADRLAALDELGQNPPGEQLRQWATRYQGQHLNPWPLLHPEASPEGQDCDTCAHLVCQTYFIENSRRRFHWHCKLGYCLHEFGRESERIWISPPECKSYERWYPSQAR